MKIVIVRDDDAPNPRDDEKNIGTLEIVCGYGIDVLYDNLKMFDKSVYTIDYPKTLKSLKKSIAIPVYFNMGFFEIPNRISTRPFYYADSSKPWRSEDRPAGVIHVSLENIRKLYQKTRVSKRVRELVMDRLTAEIKFYNVYLTSNIYGYVLYDDNGVEVDGCYGFYMFGSQEELITDMLEHAKQDISTTKISYNV